MTPQEFIDAVAAKERSERAARGLPPDHVLSFSEFPLQFTRGDVAAFERDVTAAHRGAPSALSALYCAMAACARRDYAQANLFMTDCEAMEPRDGKARMRFGTTPRPAGIALPPVTGDYPAGPALFLACNASYFGLFARTLLASLAERSPDTAVHIHYFGGDPDTIAAALDRLRLRTSLTHEDPRPVVDARGIVPALYYGAARFIRFAEALARADGPLWIADVDSLVTGDISPLLSSLPASRPAVALRVRGGRMEPWNQYSACLVGGAKASHPYFRRAADLLAADLGCAWWGMDQYALLSAAVAVEPEITLIGPDTASVVEDIPGLFWFTAGKAKARLATDQTPYAKLYRRYAAA